MYQCNTPIIHFCSFALYYVGILAILEQFEQWLIPKTHFFGKLQDNKFLCNDNISQISSLMFTPAMINPLVDRKKIILIILYLIDCISYNRGCYRGMQLILILHRIKISCTESIVQNLRNWGWIFFFFFYTLIDIVCARSGAHRISCQVMCLSLQNNQETICLNDDILPSLQLYSCQHQWPLWSPVDLTCS